MRAITVRALRRRKTFRKAKEILQQLITLYPVYQLHDDLKQRSKREPLAMSRRIHSKHNCIHADLPLTE